MSPTTQQPSTTSPKLTSMEDNKADKDVENLLDSTMSKPLLSPGKPMEQVTVLCAQADEALEKFRPTTEIEAHIRRSIALRAKMNAMIAHIPVLKAQIQDLKARQQDHDARIEHHASQMKEQFASLKAAVQANTDLIKELQVLGRHRKAELEKLEAQVLENGIQIQQSNAYFGYIKR